MRKAIILGVIFLAMAPAAFCATTSSTLPVNNLDLWSTAFNNTTGTIASTWEAVSTAEAALTQPTEIVEVRLTLSAAGGTSDDFTVTLDHRTTSTLDVVFYDSDGGLQTGRYIVWRPQKNVPIAAGDKLVFAYANPNNRTYGLEVIWRKR